MGNRRWASTLNRRLTNKEPQPQIDRNRRTSKFGVLLLACPHIGVLLLDCPHI